MKPAEVAICAYETKKCFVVLRGYYIRLVVVAECFLGRLTGKALVSAAKKPVQFLPLRTGR
jgi:hypothetical protein